MVDDMIDD